YERKIKSGSTLVAVHTDSMDEAKIAQEALKKTEAFGICQIEEAARCQPRCTVSGDKDRIKTSTTLLVLLAAIGCSAAFADDSIVAPAPTAKTDAKLSPQAKADEQKANMPPDTTSVKALNKDQEDNLNGKDEVKIDRALTTNDNSRKSEIRKDKTCRTKKGRKSANRPTSG
ncbi:MAG: hypothetical protein KGS72_28025, partial [Cyanobacteria bacterium REEB67]|nr:hypothetical protein [Cyanobacteria bacterium REEB67]